MKYGIHPESKNTVYSCGNCGTQMTMASTQQAVAKLDVCSNCHPVYTGKVTEKHSGSRIDSFNSRYRLT